MGTPCCGLRPLKPSELEKQRQAKEETNYESKGNCLGFRLRVESMNMSKMFILMYNSILYKKYFKIS